MVIWLHQTVAMGWTRLRHTFGTYMCACDMAFDNSNSGYGYGWSVRPKTMCVLIRSLFHSPEAAVCLINTHYCWRSVAVIKTHESICAKLAAPNKWRAPTIGRKMWSFSKCMLIRVEVFSGLEQWIYISVLRTLIEQFERIYSKKCSHSHSQVNIHVAAISMLYSNCRCEFYVRKCSKLFIYSSTAINIRARVPHFYCRRKYPQQQQQKTQQPTTENKQFVGLNFMLRNR